MLSNNKIIIIIIIVVLFISYKSKPPKVAKNFSNYITANHVYINEISNDKGFSIKAETIEFKKSNNLVASNVVCSFKEKEDYLNSSETIIDHDKNAFFKNKVEGQLNGIKISGSNFLYSHENHSIVTNYPSKFKHLKFNIHANKALANLKDKTITFVGNIKTEIIP